MSSLFTTLLRGGGSSIPNRALRGLYHGRQIGSGNTVSFAENKVRRKWFPNVQRKRLFSETLDRFVVVNVTTKALRHMDRKGGLDNYLLTLSPKLSSPKAEELRDLIIATKERKGLEGEAQ